VQKVSIILSTYKTEKYLERYFQSVCNQTYIANLEVSIVMNDCSLHERTIVEKFRSKINMIVTEVPRESLYASWNRAIVQSSGDLVVTWNADDLRLPDSIERMVSAFKEYPYIGWVYGDFHIVKKFGDYEGVLVKQPDWNFDIATSGAIGGPFFMWRRSLISRIGYFDEQFLSGADFDYTVRLSLLSIGKRVAGTLGYFTNDGSGLSTNKTNLQQIEKTVIQMRYGIYRTIDMYFIPYALNYQIKNIYAFGTTTKIQDLVINYEALLKSRKKSLYLMIFLGWRFTLKTLLKNLYSRCT
jgi:glycosyltransferase involved in cell wall biosynthesis